jgi:serine/threonine-protein kinase
VDTLTSLKERSLLPGPAGGLEIGPVLGEGGMGVVRSATQRSLGRDVAVKTLRDGHVSELAKGKLLREALVTGSLEHPNIVPVYDLGLDERGSPLLVLKRITGTAWRDLMKDAALVRERFGAADALEWNLRTLMQVASAVHFAHRRGIVHRDIKPENIMVGEHGEVYVLDWGIAVATTDDGSQRFPLASESTDIAGTPFYMAPEMFGGSVVTERTDVYLLGATLYEIVTGKPPHQGENLTQIMASVFDSPPVPEGVPAELQRIWSCAMANEPSARYASAEDLRLALQAFLDHRGSTKLSESAGRALHELERGLAAPDAQAIEHRETLYNCFGECAFGFRQALEDWPGNHEAEEGLRRATLAMIDYEIGHRDVRAARLLLAKLLPEDPTREAKVDAIEAELTRERERVHELAELGKDLDPHAGAKGRASLLAVFGVLWVIVPAVVGHFYPGNPDYSALFPVPFVLFVVVIVGAYVARESMRKSATNRAIVGAAALAFASQMGLHVGSALAGVSPDESQRFLMFVWFTIAAMMSICVTPRLSFAALAYLLGYFATSRWFGARYLIMSGANAVLFASSFWAWSARKARAPETTSSSTPAPRSRKGS